MITSGDVFGAPIQLPGSAFQSISLMICFTCPCSDTSLTNSLCPGMSMETSSCLPTAPHMQTAKSHPSRILEQYLRHALSSALTSEFAGGVEDRIQSKSSCLGFWGLDLCLMFFICFHNLLGRQVRCSHEVTR